MAPTYLHKICSMCKETAKLTCMTCNSSRYCSEECQEADFKTHRVLCHSFRSFRRSPSLQCVRAIYFPEGEGLPRFIWMQYKNSPPGVYPRQMLNLKELSDDGASVTIRKNHRREKDIDERILVWCNAESLLDDSNPNLSIKNVTHGRCPWPWKGPVVITKYQERVKKLPDSAQGLNGAQFYQQPLFEDIFQQPDPQGFPIQSGDVDRDDVDFTDEGTILKYTLATDVDMMDFRNVVDFFLSYGMIDHTGLYINPNDRSLGKVRGIKISRIGRGSAENRYLLEPISIIKEHPVFLKGSALPISRNIAAEVQFMRVPTASRLPQGTISETLSAKQMSDLFLNLSDTASSEEFARPLPGWDCGTRYLLLVRRDRRDLRLDHLGTIVRFYQEKIAPLVKNLVEASEDDKESMRRKTIDTANPTNFRLYLKQLKEKTA